MGYFQIGKGNSGGGEGGTGAVSSVNGRIGAVTGLAEQSTVVELITNVQTAIDKADEAFTQAVDGKTLVATAVTAKGVSASPADTFSQLAGKIGQIQTGGVDNYMIKAISENVVFPEFNVTEKIKIVLE